MLAPHKGPYRAYARRPSKQNLADSTPVSRSDVSRSDTVSRSTRLPLQPLFTLSATLSLFGVKTRKPEARALQHLAGWCGRRTVRMRNCYYHQAIYPREVVRIARVEGQPVREGNRCDHRVVGTRVRLPA